jgi:hypothetical protein
MAVWTSNIFSYYEGSPPNYASLIKEIDKTEEEDELFSSQDFCG